MLLAGLTLGLAMLASTTERSLILGDNTEKDMLPSTLAEIELAKKRQLA
jgi:hypothetical protein